MNRAILYSALFLTLFLNSIAPAFAQSFGDGLTLDKSTPISELLADPDAYVGKKVQVQGLVIDVCARRGCWIYIAGNEPFEKLRVKVVDGEIVFPMEGRGKVATVEGIFEKFELLKKEVIAKKRHHAEEQGESFDPASVTEGETVFRLRGLSAEIKGL